jgi:uncharacterized repeat protein (TIGR02543 family)
MVFILSFAPNGGDDLASVSLKYGQALPNNCIPIRSGYTFAGWFLDADLTDQFTTMPDHALTLYASWSEETPTSVFTYTKNNNEITITGLKNKQTAGHISVPSFIEGLPVKSIGDSAFADCNQLTDISLPDSLTS